jgi:hypothetical protein
VTRVRCNDRNCGWEGNTEDLASLADCPQCSKAPLVRVSTDKEDKARRHATERKAIALATGEGGYDHYRMLIALIDEAESELAVRANDYVAARRAFKANDRTRCQALHVALEALERAAVRRVEVFDKVYAELGMERDQ